MTKKRELLQKNQVRKAITKEASMATKKQKRYDAMRKSAKRKSYIE